MELRHLRYFVAVAEALHFGQAAAKLQIAQPSLSHQVRQLEDELQTSLLRRTKRRVELTEAGRLFLEEARDILARADRAAVIARRMARSDAQRLRIGIGYCMNPLDVAAAVSRFTDRHRGIQIELKTISVPSQVVALRDAQLDVGFVRPPITEASVASEVIVSEPLVVALPPKHRLASKGRIPLAALANESFVLVPRDVVPVYHDALLRACREAGFVPHAPHEADQLPLILGMVACHSGVALVPASARKIQQHRVVIRPLQPPLTNLETAVAWRRDNTSPLLTEFVKIARDVFARGATAASRLGATRA